MKLTKTRLRALILEELSLTSLMLEAEDEDKEGEGKSDDDIFGGDEGGEDKDKKDEEEGEGDVEASAKGGAEGGEDEGADEESAEGGDDEENDEEEDTDKDKDEKSDQVLGPVGDEVDTALKDVMADFEKRALDTAAAKAKVEPVGAKNEGRLSLARMLFEADDDDEVLIDVGTFASDIARLIQNYDTLIDMEGVIYTKAMDFMEKKYGKDYADQLRDTLARDYNIEIDVEQDPEKAEQPIYAVGAASSAGGA